MADGTEHIFPGVPFINTALEALRAKDDMSRFATIPYLQRAAMAGIVICVFYVAYFSTVAMFTSMAPGGTLKTLGKAVGGLLFGWALVFIYFTKSELLTSNMMVVSIGGYYKRVGWKRGLGIMTLCYLGNAVGALLVGLFVKFSTLAEGHVLESMVAAVDIKLGYVAAGPTGLVDLFIRAVLCNFMINLAMLVIYNGYLKGDFAKMSAMIMAVFVFVFLGLEHSVANTALFIIVWMRDGLDVALAAGNVAVALIGNFVGGGLLIGAYYAYVNDFRRHLKDSDTAMQQVS